MKVIFTFFLILQLSVVVKVSELTEDVAINYKEKYLKNEIDISDLRSEISRLKSENYYLSKQITKYLNERENCSEFTENVDKISASLMEIQKNLLPIQTHYDLKYNTNNQTNQEKLLLENSAKTKHILNELEKQLASAAGQLSHISDKEFQNKKSIFENQKSSNDLVMTTENVAKQSLMKSCADATDNEECLIQIPSYCIVFRESNNWIVILRPIDGTVNFQRSWNEYKDGFGDLKANYFMGLEKIHQLTTFQCYELKVVLEDFENNQAYALYDRFAIGGEDEGYALNTLGRYSGTAGDGLKNHKNAKWTSIDKDNDEWDDGNCAEHFKGGWWHNEGTNSKLTGLYIPGGFDRGMHGIVWYDWRARYSFKSAKMLIKQKACS